MRLKEIKEGMKIICETRSELYTLIEHLYELGYEWLGVLSDVKMLDYEPKYKDAIIIHKSKKIASTNNIENGITFKSLVVPELTAEEVLQIKYEICNKYSNEGENCASKCPFYNEMFCIEWIAKNPKETIAICERWKEEHEKKEPEVEWYFKGYIFGVDKDGIFFQRKDGYFDIVAETREEAEKYMEDVLKKFISEHEGNFVAEVKHICRVKESED